MECTYYYYWQTPWITDSFCPKYCQVKSGVNSSATVNHIVVCHAAFSLVFCAVPLVLKSCTEVIERYGIVDGIYRLSGITSNIQKLRSVWLLGSPVKSLPPLGWGWGCWGLVLTHTHTHVRTCSPVCSHFDSHTGVCSLSLSHIHTHTHTHTLTGACSRSGM